MKEWSQADFAADTWEHNGVRLPYRYYVPAGTGPFALVIYLHGAGERGNDNALQLPPIVRLLAQPESPARRAVILAPQCPADSRWVDYNWDRGCYRLADVAETPWLAAVAALVERWCADPRVDAKRVYATGYSMGGFGTWDLLARHSNLFAAGLPLCGGGPVDAADRLAAIPLRVIHGVDDAAVPVTASRAMAQAILPLGPVDFVLTERPGVGHNVWDDAYDDPALAAWLFAQRRA